MEKTTKKLRTERDTAIQERDELKQQLSMVSSELVAYKEAEEKRGLFTRDKLKKESRRISHEDELSRELKKANAFISAYGLAEDFARYRYNKSRNSELE